MLVFQYKDTWLTREKRKSLTDYFLEFLED